MDVSVPGLQGAYLRPLLKQVPSVVLWVRVVTVRNRS